MDECDKYKHKTLRNQKKMKYLDEIGTVVCIFLCLAIVALILWGPDY